MLASIVCDANLPFIMSMGVKANKTFEEIVERLAALFKVMPRPGERDYEETIEIDLNRQPSQDLARSAVSPKNKK
jgi:hypothetical protein